MSPERVLMFGAALLVFLVVIWFLVQLLGRA